MHFLRTSLSLYARRHQSASNPPGLQWSVPTADPALCPAQAQHPGSTRGGPPAADTTHSHPLNNKKAAQMSRKQIYLQSIRR